MTKIAYDAGHGMSTSGKRTPDGEREWMFNNKVAIAFADKLKQYENVELLRLDDPSGNRDVPLSERTDKANAWGADVLISFHHNALAGSWGTHSGIETYTHPQSSAASKEIQRLIHPRIALAMGLKDREMKEANFHMLRESNMPSVLIEGGFMDSTIDIQALRNDAKLKAQGEVAAQALVNLFFLKPKNVSTTTSLYRVFTGTFNSSRSLADAIEMARREFTWVFYERAESLDFNPTYRIFTGTFKTKAAAEEAKVKLQQKFGWITYIREEVI
ncbi:N-acetylmuramoyl-L-alanine amidase [Chungangia koreensis]|uniref:N-acetylmuramoyl-L-alanine amidase n=1 Tax=Chungangia koreensis TaxID=752657 RepID=A0ABV8X0I5_9LACT